MHAFTSGDHLMLGGVRIPHTRGIRAHSDGDVVIHALCDALLGAAGLGDIGRHFPDTDARWRGAASRVFLGEVIRMLAERHYRVAALVSDTGSDARSAGADHIVQLPFDPATLSGELAALLGYPGAGGAAFCSNAISGSRATR